MLEPLEQLDDLGSAMARDARDAGVRLIWRNQLRGSKRSVVRQGRVEGNAASTLSGHGAQVVTADGRVALASRDDFKPDEARRLLQRVIATAAGAERLGLQAADASALEPVIGREIPVDPAAFDAVDLPRVGERLKELERELQGRVPGPTLSVSFRSELDSWRIFRDDGTDVFFAMPRCVLGMRATGSGDGGRHGVSATLFSPDPNLPFDDGQVDLFLRRATQAAELARVLPDAPNHAAGSFPLVIDYALAKGLAHEAFGHASEADGFRSSILAKDGKFKVGEQVGPETISIIDEPVGGDHAWQPFSSNGVRRQRTEIVRAGRLLDGLSDPWSAKAGGVRLTGAGRAESFRSAPQPRMTNIRIESSEPLAAPGVFEDYGPEEVRELLAASGVFKRHPKVVYLSGYTGGQVNTAGGDFVFHCKAIYDLDERGVSLYKPAIFSGSMFGALQSVREAYGPLLLDAIGYCGKWGQQVPSSGGSHYFLVLEPHESVGLGGRE
jgi:TldD protein